MLGSTAETSTSLTSLGCPATCGTQQLIRERKSKKFNSYKQIKHKVIKAKQKPRMYDDFTLLLILNIVCPMSDPVGKITHLDNKHPETQTQTHLSLNFVITTYC